LKGKLIDLENYMHSKMLTANNLQMKQNQEV